MGWNANFSYSHPRQSIKFDLDNDGIPEIIDIWTPDCEWGSWSAWSSCSHTCGQGSLSRTREIIRNGEHNGVLCKTDDRTVSKGTVLGGFGNGSLTKAETPDCVSWSLPEGDKTYVQLAQSEEEADRPGLLKTGTLYTVIKPVERAASKKGARLALTSYGKFSGPGCC